MKYLGETIHTMIHTGYRGRLFEYETLECTFDTVDDAKQHIRKQILPLYQPTKTLNWLKEKTGHSFRYLHNHKQLVSIGYNDVYDFNDNTTCVYNNKICIISESANGDWIKMSPQEFIEKIERGEWI